MEINIHIISTTTSKLVVQPGTMQAPLLLFILRLINLKIAILWILSRKINKKESSYQENRRHFLTIPQLGWHTLWSIKVEEEVIGKLMTYGQMLEYVEADVLLPGHHRYNSLTGLQKGGKAWMVQVLWEDNSKTC